MNQIMSFVNTSFVLNKSNKQEGIKTNDYILYSKYQHSWICLWIYSPYCWHSSKLKLLIRYIFPSFKGKEGYKENI